MEVAGEKNCSYSLHEFRLIVEGKRNTLSNKDFIKEQKSLLITSGINLSLSNKRTVEIRTKSNFLGKQGWVISPFWHPGKEETWYDTWFWLAYNNQEEKITTYFTENNFALLECINGYSRFEVNRADWFIEAEALFKKCHYASCAMLLTAILEQSIRKCPIAGWHHRVTIFFDNAVSKKIEDYYSQNFELLNNYIETVLLLPSIDGFINTYFNSGYNFGKDKENRVRSEPPFLERNWLMHGMTQREILSSDCIKLFNAISGLHYILKTIFQEDSL
ncbi:MAG: hypothetical protein F8N38_10200 [Hungatella sp.]|nr:hypothetical protein [Hungatella sp.]